MNPFKLLKSLFATAPRRAVADCAGRVRSGAAVLIDVREAGEWAGGVAEHAMLLPLTDLAGSRTRWTPFLAAHDGRELLLYCAVGGRSGIAARILATEGHRAANAGALPDWKAAGWPIVRPPAGRA